MPAPRCAALDAKNGSQRRFPQGRRTFQPNMGQTVRQAYRDGGFSLARWGGGNGRNQHQIGLFFAVGLQQFQGQLGLVLAVVFQGVRRNADAGRCFREGARLRRACDFQIRHDPKVGKNVF